MKTIKYFILLFALCSVFSACTGPAGRDGRDGRDFEMKIVDFDVPVESWFYSDLYFNNFYRAEVDMPEVTRQVMKGGVVKVYRKMFRENSRVEYQKELPMVTHLEYYEESVGDWLNFTETIDYDFELGKLYVNYTASDFAYEIYPDIVPDAMQFRCVVYY